MKTTYTILFLILAIGTFSCTKSSDAVVLQSISFAPETLTVMHGTTQQLNPVFTPLAFSNIPVVWSSSDASVVTVSPTGLISSSATGEAWVTIKDKNSATKGKCLIIVQ